MTAASSSTARNNVRVCFSGAYALDLQHEEIGSGVGDDELLVKCVYSLISSGTELSLYTGVHKGIEDPNHHWAKYPFYPGYAAVGEVEVVGSSVENFAPGDLVFYPGHHQRYAVVSPGATPVLPVPAELPPKLAPFARFGQIANTAVAVSAVAKDDVVVVIGLGLVGNLAAQLFGLQGASVIGVDLVGFRREVAARTGIPVTVDAENRDVVRAVLDATGGEGARIVVEATGHPTLVAPALRMARTRGEVILLGSPLTSSRATEPLDVSMLDLIHRKGISLKGAHETLIPRMPVDRDRPNQRAVMGEMLRLLHERRLAVEPLISRVVGPAGIEQAYRSLLSEKDTTMTILIDWTEE